MELKILEALKGSIKKWENIVEGIIEDEGSLNCTLCQVIECEYCPVYFKSGKCCWNGTPYLKWCRYLRNQSIKKVFDKKSLQLAKDELEFLRSLLPDEKNKYL